MPDWLHRRTDGIELDLKVTPRAGRSAVQGTVPDAARGTRLAVRLEAAPVDGAANAALLRLLADALDVPRSACRLVAGETARLKRVRITGDPVVLEARARALLSGAEA